MLPSADEREINRVPEVRRELKFAAGNKQLPAGCQPALAAENAAKVGHPVSLIGIGSARRVTNL